MIVTLLGKNILYKTKLPQYPVGNYWITDENDKKIISIEGNGNVWEIFSNNKSKIINPKNMTSLNVFKIAQSQENIIEKITLKDYGMYYVYLKDYSNNAFIIYCTPDYEKDFSHLNIKNSQEILIGKSDECDIVYNNSLLKKIHARIFFSNGKLMLENFDDNFGTFVNNKPVDKGLKLLFNGDVIFIMGLKIIIIGRGIFINNPYKRVTYSDEVFEINQKTIKVLEKEDDDTDNVDIQLYSEKDYFARAPKITNVIEKERIIIDPPPPCDNKEAMPLVLLLGSSLSMGVVMILSIMSTIDRIVTGTATLKSSIFSIITSLVMLISIVSMPLLTRLWEKKQKLKNEEKRQKRYREYINSKISLIDNIMKKQKELLYENHISAEECAQIIVNKGSRLWERKIDDENFLAVRIGIGDIPLELDIEYPRIEFTMEDDNLVEILNTIVNKSKILKNVPITIPLREKNVSGLIVKDNDRLIEKFTQNLIMQLVALHSYEDLKLVFLLDEDNRYKWEHLKILPHVWDDSKQVRFWADNYDDMKEISRYLEEEFIKRLEFKKNDNKYHVPYYLIITNDYKKIENLRIITQILETKTNLGFGIFCISNNLLDLPNGCQCFINLEDNKGVMFENELSSKSQKEFAFDPSYTFFFEKVGKQLSSIPIKYTVTNNASFPENYTFLEMFDVGKIQQLNILERWKKNNSANTLQVPIGIDVAGMPIVLDVHEKFHGPHGLIAGSTGSGKSEFIKTYILSLAVNYHPEDVSIIIIDYKGGDLAGAFQSEKVKLPHLVGTITNIETIGLRRNLASIQSELRRRQVLFKEAKNKIEEGNLDIYKYQRLYHEGVLKEPVPHLLIICDEFAELKQQQQEFMDELISVARIGRSLGVHLILATQKPAGIVDNQIRSNSKFGVCLKVQEREDSIDVIKKPDAAELKKAGQFYLQVGNNEYFTLGLVAWSGAPYMPADIVKKNVDNSIKFISNTGAIIKEVGKNKKQNILDEGEQITNIVKVIEQIAKQENIEAKPLWLENIPEIIYLEELKKKYKIKKTKNIINPIVGEFDDPCNQRQGVVELNLSTQGNTIIYGNAESGKETLLSTIIYDIMTSYSTEEAQMYILDFGSEALKIFKESPSVGDVVFTHESEKLSRLIEMIQANIRERTAILSDYNGDYNLYISMSGKSMPMIIVIVNNYEVFVENYGNDYEDTFLTLTREGSKCGIVFVVTANLFNSLKYRLSHNFRQRIALQLNNKDDYLSIFDGVGNKKPSSIFGRGLVKLEDIYEFQTARISEPEKWNSHIKEINEELKKKNNNMVPKIPVLPHVVTFDDVKTELKNLSKVPIGINKKNLEIFTYDFKKEFMNVITAKNIDIATRFTANLIDEIKLLNNVEVIILDAERILQTGEYSFKQECVRLKDSLTKTKNIICVIIGIDKFINGLNDTHNEFLKILKTAENSKKMNFIIVENFLKIKSHAYEEWYKNYITSDTGIWVGNGVAEQYVLNVNVRDKNIINRCGESFGHVIIREQITAVKLLGMKDDGDEDE